MCRRVGLTWSCFLLPRKSEFNVSFGAWRVNISYVTPNLKENVMSEKNGWSGSIAGMPAVGASTERSRKVSMRDIERYERAN